VETFQYNNANELTRQVVDGFIQSFVYDDWGRMVTKTRGGYQAAYKYRFGDKLKQINTNFPGESAAQVEYTYDGLGKRRVMLLGGTATQWQRYDIGWNVLGEYAHSGSDWSIGARTNSYTWVGMTPLSETSGTNPGTGASQYYLHDRLGSTRDLFNGSKVKTARLDYEPHGQLTNAYGDFPGRSFTGKQFETESGLYHFPYRHYSPDQARWMQRDPLGMVDGPNVYAYVRGQLHFSVDPIGKALKPGAVVDPLENCTQMWLVCLGAMGGVRGGTHGQSHCTDCMRRCQGQNGVWPDSVNGKPCGGDPGGNPNNGKPDTPSDLSTLLAILAGAIAAAIWSGLTGGGCGDMTPAYI
jgi:RHS repeat-associated protein